MALEDFTDPEVAIVAAVAAAVFSPRVRGWLRRGAVYSMAGVLVAGDAISSVARGVGQGVQQAGTAAAHSAQNAMNQAKNNASSSETAAANANQNNTTQQ
jgi:hypothetical protein